MTPPLPRSVVRRDGPSRLDHCYERWGNTLVKPRRYLLKGTSDEEVDRKLTVLRAYVERHHGKVVDIARIDRPPQGLRSLVVYVVPSDDREANSPV